MAFINGQEVVFSPEVNLLEGALTTEINKDSTHAEYPSAKAVYDFNQLNGCSPIVNTESGKVVTMNDSAKAPLQSLKLYGKTTQRTTTGKNMLEINEAAFTTVAGKTFVNKGITYTLNEDKSVTINGTATDLSQFRFIEVPFIPKGRYILSGYPTNVTSMFFYYFKTPDSGWVNYVGEVELNYTEDTEGFMLLSIAKGAVINNLTIYPMLRKAEITDNTYEPYTGGIPSPNIGYPQELVSVGESGSFEVGVYGGKNFVEITTDTKTSAGVTFTRNADNSFSLSGTCQNNVLHHIGKAYLIKGTSYKLTGCPSGGAANTYLLRLTNKNNVIIKEDTGTGATFAPNETGFYTVGIRVQAGTNTAGLKFYPMIRYSSETDEAYEPCNKQTLTMPYELRSDKAGIYKDTVDFNKGVFVRRIQPIPFDENSINSMQRVEQPAGSGIYRFQAHPNADNPAVKMRFLEGGETLSTFLPFGTTPLGNNSKNNVITTYANGGIYFRCDSITSAEEFLQMARANNWEAQGVLETPVEIPLTETELNAYRQLLTNKGTTNILCEADMEVSYVSDTKLYIDNKFAELTALVLEG